jgi:dTDP-4-dehydrorhamnose 3,5-epimerase
MDEINIEGVILTPLKKIIHPKGDILHGIKKNEHGYAGFGEAYFSTINKGEIKGWNRHRIMTLNLVVPIGEVTFILYDDRENNITEGKIFKVTLSQNNYHRLTIPPGLWLAFKGNSNNTNLILNIANMEHDSNEIDRLDLGKIDYNWESV